MTWVSLDERRDRLRDDLEVGVGIARFDDDPVKHSDWPGKGRDERSASGSEANEEGARNSQAVEPHERALRKSVYG